MYATAMRAASRGSSPMHLKPGESRSISLTLDRRSFAFWSGANKNWDVDPGRFAIFAGDCSEHVPLRQDVTLVKPDKL